MQTSDENFPDEDISALVELVEEGEITPAELVQQLQRAQLADVTVEGLYERVSRWLERQDSAADTLLKDELAGASSSPGASSPGAGVGSGSGGLAGRPGSRPAGDVVLVSLLEKVRQRRRYYASQAERLGNELKRLRRMLAESLRPEIEEIHTEALDRLTELAGDISELRTIRDELLQRREERLREQLASASETANTLEIELTEALREDDGERAADCMLRIETLARELEENLGLSPGQIAKARQAALERYRAWVYAKCGSYLRRLGPWPTSSDAAFLRKMEASGIAAQIRALAQQSIRIFRGQETDGLYGGGITEDDDRRSAASEMSSSTACRASGRDRRYFEFCFLQTQSEAFEHAFREAARSLPAGSSPVSKTAGEEKTRAVSSGQSDVVTSGALIDYSIHYLEQFAERYRLLLRTMFDGMNEDVDSLVESLIHEFIAIVAEIVYSELENRYGFLDGEETGSRSQGWVSPLQSNILTLVDALVAFDRDMAMAVVAENHSLMHSWMEAEFQASLGKLETCLRTRGALGIVLPGSSVAGARPDLFTEGRAIRDALLGNQASAPSATAFGLDSIYQASEIGETLHSLATRCRALPPHPHRARYRFAQSVIAPLIGWLMAQIHYLMTETEAHCAKSLAELTTRGTSITERQLGECYLSSPEALYRTLSYAAAAYLLAEDIRQRIELYLYEVEVSNAPDRGPDSELESDDEQSARSDVIGAGNPYDGISAEVSGLRKLSSKALASYADTITDMLAPCFLLAEAKIGDATPGLMAQALRIIQELVALSEHLLRGHRTLLLWFWAPFFLQLDAKLAMSIAQWWQQIHEDGPALSLDEEPSLGSAEAFARDQLSEAADESPGPLPIDLTAVQQLVEYATSHFQLRHAPLQRTQSALLHMQQLRSAPLVQR
ncbi:hypothetical protein CCYA_CCYA04G1405 [Cyanidiococcus yangmingshanensis]|nr:hypothetical protein CCYA_CCYA04G1405 [Cyanidiococcus yangmingshanensis]